MSTPARAPYIEFRNVTVRYTDLVHALRGVSLQIEKGDFVFFVGRTGAGKSTLIKLLTREVKHDSGEVFFHGRDLGALRSRDIPELRREMGIVPQDFALLPRKKVWENVAYAMRAVGHTRRQVRAKVPEILERVNMAHRVDAYPNELSGGEQQRVAIARALINSPALLVADEPTGNLDPEHSWEIMELLRSLNARGTTVIVASHDMMVVERMARRLIRLDQGLVISDEAPRPFEAPNVPAAAVLVKPFEHLESEEPTLLPVGEPATPAATEEAILELKPDAVGEGEPNQASTEENKPNA